MHCVKVQTQSEIYRRFIADILRRIAQKLSPVLTDKQINELREYYDTHNAFSGEPLNILHANNLAQGIDIVKELRNFNAQT